MENLSIVLITSFKFNLHGPDIWSSSKSAIRYFVFWYFVFWYPGFCWMYSGGSSLLYIPFIGQITSTSRGWVSWLVCGGKTKSEMCLLFHSVKVRFTSDLCRSFVKYKSWLLRRPCVLDKEFGQVVLEYLANKPSRFQHPSICFWCCIFRNFWIPPFSIKHIILWNLIPKRIASCNDAIEITVDLLYSTTCGLMLLSQMISMENVLFRILSRQCCYILTGLSWILLSG